MSNTDKFISDAKEQLKALPEILDLPALIAAHSEKNIEYRVENMDDGCFGYPLFNNGEVAVQIIFMKAGAIFPRHLHKVTEWLLVYKGKLQFFNGHYVGKVVKAGNDIKIDPTISHRVLAIEETWMVGITIPAGRGYPK